MVMTHIEHKPEGLSNPPTLVVLPGVNSGAYLFKPLVEQIGETHRLIILNPPGVAGVPLPLPFSVSSYAHHVLGLLKELGVERFALMGHSLGGFAAQQVAREARERIERLVLVGTGPGQPYTSQDMSGFVKATGMTYWELCRATEHAPHDHLRHLFGPRFPAVHPHEYDEFVKIRSKALPGKAVTLAQLMAGGVFSSARWAKDLAMPALVIHGGADILVSANSGRTLAQLLPNARYLEFFGVGHFPMLEHPGFYPALKRFLEGHVEGVEPPPMAKGFLGRMWDKWFIMHG